jgi:hypothetical protein
MNATDPTPQPPAPAGTSMRTLGLPTSYPFADLLSGLVFLFFHFGVGLVGTSESALYNQSTAVFTEGCLVAGILLIAAAAFGLMRTKAATLVDLLVNALVGLFLVAIAAIWLAWGNFLALVLGVWSLLHLRTAWDLASTWRLRQRVDRARAEHEHRATP